MSGDILSHDRLNCPSKRAKRFAIVIELAPDEQTVDFVLFVHRTVLCPAVAVSASSV